MGKLSNSVIKGERLFSKIGNISVMIFVIIAFVGLFGIHSESDEQLKKESTDDDDYKVGLFMKKYALPIFIIILILAYLSNQSNKLIQKSNKVALAKGGLNIGSFIGNSISR